MAEIVEMPKLSDTMTEGVIAAWHKNVGDEIASGELMAEIETDKATMDLESFFDGVLLHKGAEDGEAIPLGGLLAIIGEKGEDVSAIVEQYANKAAAPAEEKAEEVKEAVAEVATVSAGTTTAPVAMPVANGNGDGRLKASPLAKAIAKERGIDLKLVQGTGDGGRVVKRDVESYTPSVAPAAVVGVESARDERVSQMRKTIARRLSESKNTAPHFYLTMEIDMVQCVEARKAINEIAPVKISFNDIIIKAVAASLKQHPGVNASWQGDVIRYYDHVHVGMAVAIDDGLIVPVIRFADSLSLSQISGQARSLAERARNRDLQPHEWEGNTFTISNLGMFGIEEFTAIINSPDACILAVGGIMDKPVVKDGQIVPGKTMKVTLSCDHRVVDGAVGSAFLKTLKSLLENPVRILV